MRYGQANTTRNGGAIMPCACRGAGRSRIRGRRGGGDLGCRTGGAGKGHVVAGLDVGTEAGDGQARRAEEGGDEEGGPEEGCDQEGGNEEGRAQGVGGQEGRSPEGRAEADL